MHCLCDSISSVCRTPHIPFVYSVSEGRRKFAFYGSSLYFAKSRSINSIYIKLISMISSVHSAYYYFLPAKMQMDFFLKMFFWKPFFLLIDAKPEPLFHLVWHTDSTPRILLHDCQKLEVVAEIFPLEGAAVVDRGIFKSSLNLDCKLLVISVVPLFRWRFSRNSLQRLFREGVSIFVQIAFSITHSACKCLRTARSTSSERASLLVFRLATTRQMKGCTPLSVCLSRANYDSLKIGST